MAIRWRSREYDWPGVPDEVWLRIRHHLPPPPKQPRRRKDRSGGRPRAPDQRSFGAILWVARSGRQWRELPPRFGSARTAQRRLASWAAGWRLEAMFRTYIALADDREAARWAEVFHANRCRRWSPWIADLERTYREDARAARHGLGAGQPEPL